MKIKRERQVRLDELIGYITKNELVSSVFKSNRGNEIVVDINGDLNFFGRFNYKDLFTITEEVNITEEMELKQLVVIYNNGGSGKIRNMNIKELVERQESVYGHGVPIKFVYLQNEDGSIGELIWSKEKGIL